MNNDVSETTLRRLEQNDPTLTCLVVRSTSRNDGDFCPNDKVGLSRFSNAIAANTHVHSLSFDRSGIGPLGNFSHSDRAIFWGGLKRNTSIKTLVMGSCDFSEGIGREISREFVVDNANLEKIFGVDIRGGIDVLSSSLARCTNLRFILLFSSAIDDGDVEELVSGIRGLHRLKKLSMTQNAIGRTGCEALATLFRDPNYNLEKIALEFNNIDDDCATILANSLKDNSKLKCVSINPSNHTITGRGWEAFANILCNESSVNATYLSNHALYGLGKDDENNPTVPPKLSSLLELNQNTDKKCVAIQKILRHHSHLDMMPLLEWDLKVLPIAVSWFDRARGYSRNGEENNVDAKKLSSIYQFVRALPLMFVPPTKKAGEKRKIDNIN